MFALQPKSLPIMGRRETVNAQNDSQRAQEHSTGRFFRSL
jgi:hypothetical protein